MYYTRKTNRQRQPPFRPTFSNKLNTSVKRCIFKEWSRERKVFFYLFYNTAVTFCHGNEEKYFQFCCRLSLYDGKAMLFLLRYGMMGWCDGKVNDCSAIPWCWCWLTKPLECWFKILHIVIQFLWDLKMIFLSFNNFNTVMHLCLFQVGFLIFGCFTFSFLFIFVELLSWPR